MSQEVRTDAYTPKEVAARLESLCVVKANMSFPAQFILSMLAGVFIAFGGALSTLVMHDSKLSFGQTQLLGGFVFCLGLILIVIAGAELFTGNNLLVMPLCSKKIKLSHLFGNWAVVYLGNFAGSILMVLLIYMAQLWSLNDSLVGGKMLLIADTKVGLPFEVAFTRGILCNALVCLAIWMVTAGRSTTDKIISILFPITAFSALGFEHSIANMYFIPIGLLIKNNPTVLDAAASLSKKPLDLSDLTIAGTLVNNLLPVTLGNIVGGTVLIGLVYWYVFLRAKPQEG